ncbi:MAG: FtsX-like permease family protein [Bacteroidota bacterium]|jgi:ABC-type lipoprotein release transport system permease subunit
MKYYFLFSWRNLWRNKRRTLLATSSIFFAVLLTVLFAALNYGQDDDTMRMSVSLSTGYLQIQEKGYWDERSLEKSFEVRDGVLGMVRSFPRITLANPRIESVALVSYGTETRISPVIGIDPETENRMTGLKKRIVKGSYLNDSSQGILIAEGLADRLHLSVGDSIVLFSQGYQGATAAEQLAIAGILHFPVPKMNDAMVYLSLPKAQTFFNANRRVTSIALMVDDPRKVHAVQSSLSQKLDPDLVLINWEEMLPEVVQAIQANDAGSLLTFGVFYVVIAFGVFGTIMMMTIERTREFGLLISLGMKRGRLFLVTTLEAVLISMVGAIAGLAVSIPVVFYFHHHPIHIWGDLAKAYESYGMEPIMSVNADASLFYSQTIIVFIIALIASLYPLFVIRKLRPVSALQGRNGKK